MPPPSQGTAADAAADSSPPLTAVKVDATEATDTMADTVRRPRAWPFALCGAQRILTLPLASAGRGRAKPRLRISSALSEPDSIAERLAHLADSPTREDSTESLVVRLGLLSTIGQVLANALTFCRPCCARGEPLPV